jgi:UMF1 family MFS transporter
VQTIVYVATVFAEKELNFESTEMIAIVLVLQLVAIGGAYLFAYISKITSNKTSLISMILIWILICFGAYLCEGKAFFYVLSAMVGLVLGGIQSMSRSTYSKMIDENEEDVTSFFSFYDVLYKCSLVVGSFSFGLVDFITGNIRNSVLVLMLYFIIGLWLLVRTNLSGPKAA